MKPDSIGGVDRIGDMDRMKIISLGAGVQSSTMYLMSSLNELERADHAIFADPGREKPETYKWLEYLLDWQERFGGIPIHWQKDKDLYQDLLNWSDSTGQRFASIPVFTNKGKGQLRRQCTQEYKIEIVRNKMRELYGLKKGQWLPITEVWIGFSIDEIERVKDSRNNRIVYKHPLVDELMSRQDCEKWLRDWGFPVPVKSSCDFCPYQSDYSWKTVQKNRPDDWQELVRIDESIRDSSKKGIKEQCYLHRSGEPLETASFLDQEEMFNEYCVEGYCGV